MMSWGNRMLKFTGKERAEMYGSLVCESGYDGKKLTSFVSFCVEHFDLVMWDRVRVMIYDDDDDDDDDDET